VPFSYKILAQKITKLKCSLCNFLAPKYCIDAKAVRKMLMKLTTALHRGRQRCHSGLEFSFEFFNLIFNLGSFLEDFQAPF
jgi:hypothetical protein